MAMLVAIVGCGGSASPAPASATTPSAAAVPSSTGPASSTPTAGTSTPSAVIDRLVVVDPDLLAVLPAQVAGIALTPDAETAASIAADPTLASDVEALALAAVFGPLPSGDVGGDYAVATVVRLLPGTFSDGFFRSWRDTFDAGVCEQAGGVDGHAQAELGGRTVWIGTCAGGVHTYHAVLRDESVIVSAQSAGPGRFGEQIMAGLTE